MSPFSTDRRCQWKGPSVLAMALEEKLRATVRTADIKAGRTG